MAASTCGLPVDTSGSTTSDFSLAMALPSLRSMQCASHTRSQPLAIGNAVWAATHAVIMAMMSWLSASWPVDAVTPRYSWRYHSPWMGIL